MNPTRRKPAPKPKAEELPSPPKPKLEEWQSVFIRKVTGQWASCRHPRGFAVAGIVVRMEPRGLSEPGGIPDFLAEVQGVTGQSCEVSLVGAELQFHDSEAQARSRVKEMQTQTQTTQP